MSFPDIKLVLSDSCSPDTGGMITAQLICGPRSDSICDYMPSDIGLDKQTIDALAARSSDDDAAREVGERLMAALQSKETIREALRDARDFSECPVSLILAGQMVNRLPWETLFDSSWPGFLEFRGTMPTSRAVPCDRSGTAPAFLDRPRILAILSAPAPGQTSPDGATGLGDWSHAEFKQLTEAAGAAGVDVDLRLMTSEQSVLDAAAGAEVMAEQIRDEDSIIEKIKSFDPHILHFFCHGFDQPSPHLKFYKPADIWTNDPQISIDADAITRHIGCTCLVVLNSCSGASAKDGTQSLAQTLVEKRFPAVIGMKEAVDWHDATRFTFGLYRHILRALRLHRGDQIDLRLLAALESPRRNLLSGLGPVDEAAEQHRKWTLPILYTRPRGVFVPVMSDDRDEPPYQTAQREGEHLAIRSVTRNLHQDTPGQAVGGLTRFADQLTGQAGRLTEKGQPVAQAERQRPAPA